MGVGYPIIISASLLGHLLGPTQRIQVQYGWVYEQLTPCRRFAMMPIASVQEKAVIEMMRKTGPCCLDDLVTHLLNLSWGEVFVAVDRMSRDGRLLLRQRGYSSYEITLPSELTSPHSPSRQDEAQQ
jgi:hypothetical protein